MNYWINDDPVTNTAIVHLATCSHCNNGRGRGVKPKTAEWLGPFASHDEAFAQAEKTGRTTVRGCLHCNP